MAAELTWRKAIDKEEFSKGLHAFVQMMRNYVSSENREWTVKGFIDIYRNITLGSHGAYFKVRRQLVVPVATKRKRKDH